MRAHRFRVLVVLGLTFVSTWWGFRFFIEPWRSVEAVLASSALRLLGVDAVGQSYGSMILVVPPRGGAFLADVTPSCASLAAVLAFAAMSAFLVAGTPLRRLGSFLLASAVVIGGNQLRIGLSVWVGATSQRSNLVAFHDWMGTLIGIGFLLGGFMAFLALLLPSNRQILAEVGRGA